ncbi:unnamed protein product [Saimiriine gammaherpesvirus 2]|uniref:Probable membrane antigen 3 n=1 Tax=Saimiriine herpesvirus 2 (strain 11) TaxID=10383 RepID=VP03_SHV21|nr:unnamed protein product [Saimiriine gammaherpesvirus 2]Q01000.1 RecName: Full=Probable membrane antigen 3; AltName: Full=Tegument protein [Herpesvirus saimiri (strain 11)]pir/C36806/ hypothetical protein ORF3 - saimiriine herpesvirus 1 (strain 11) [Saimiriine alphaherpesvirus 1]CAA45625.1 unnamed protein product [Saimiriine gammaherpesvirus 2]
MLVLHFNLYEAQILPHERLATSVFLEHGPLQVTSFNPTTTTGYVVYVNSPNASFLEPVLSKLFQSVSPKLPFFKFSEQTLSFSYGPHLQGSQTTFSKDLVDVVKNLSMFTPQGPENAFTVERIEYYRTIHIICDLKDPKKRHIRHLQKMLCNPYTGLTNFVIPQDKRLEMDVLDAESAVSAPLSDPLWTMSNGLFNLLGYSSQYSVFKRGAAPKVFVEKNSRLAISMNIDYWNPWSSTNMLYDGLHAIEKGLIYSFGSFTPTPSLTSVFNMAQHWYVPMFSACQIGHVMQLPLQTHELSLTGSLPMKMLQAHLNLLKCSSMPHIQGFFRLVPKDLSHILPQTKIYNGFISTSLCLQTINMANEHPLQDKTYLYQLGNFFTYHKQFLTCQESGKEIGSILTALAFFLDSVKTYPGTIVGMSTSLPVASMKAKLAAVCQQVCGARLLVSALPPQVVAKLAPFSPSNRVENKKMLKQYFFNLLTSDLIIAIKNVNIDAQAALKTACYMAGCRFKKIGLLTHLKGTEVVDNTVERPYPILRFDRFKPKFPLLSSPTSITFLEERINWQDLNLRDTILKILEHPSVGCKEFIVNHTDKLISGRVARTSIVGPWQLPVSDYSILVPMHPCTTEEVRENPWDYETDIDSHCVFEEAAVAGICSAIGESTILTQADLKVGTIRAITEAILNLSMVPWNNIGNIVIQLSITLPYTAHVSTYLQLVMETAKTFCEALRVSCTFTANATEGGASIVASAIVNTLDVSKCITPDLKFNNSFLFLLTTEKDYSLFGSVAQQILEKTFIGEIPSATSPVMLKKMLSVLQTLIKDESVVSGHDVSDGGLVATVAEMALSGGKGVRVYVPHGEDAIKFLCSETPGVVIEVQGSKMYYVQQFLHSENINFQIIGESTSSLTFSISQNLTKLVHEPLELFKSAWRSFSDACEPCQIHPRPYRMQIATVPKYCPVGPCRFHTVIVYLLPNNSVPHGLLNAIEEAGFQPRLVSIHQPSKTTNVYDPHTVWGFFIVGASNVQDEDVGMRALIAQLKSHVAFQRDLRTMLAKPDVFSVAIGALACELLFYNKAIGYNKPSDTYMTCVKNSSRKFESRWSNIYIPESTKAIAFQSLKNSLIPCWTQGTHLKFYHPKPMLEKMEESGMVSSMFYGHSLSSGPAQNYPLTPNGENAIAGVCSADGRHLALLHDPSLCNNLWQWPYVPLENPPLKVSPWKTMFLDLHKWGITVQGASPPPSRTSDPLRSFVF